MKKGFTLVEVLVAVGLFAIAATVSTTLLVSIVNLQKKASVQNAVYEDARILMQQLTKEIQNGTIDYEEYYSINVAQKRLPAGGPYFGINYGVYASRFFDPGKKLVGNAKNPDDLGVECSFPNPLPANQQCEIVYNLSADLSTGQNPYKKPFSQPQNANALCDRAGNNCDALTSHAVNELYLIDSTGTRKTIIGRKKMVGANVGSSDYSVGLVRMKGIDFDQNGFTDIFSCTEEFSCAPKNNIAAGATVFPFLTRLRNNLPPDQQGAFDQQYIDLNVSLPQQGDLNEPFTIADTQFLPITPIKSNVVDLKFILNPIEDPYKAYAEAAVQQQPSVTIILTLGLNSVTRADYPGNFEPLTVQTTVEAGVVGKIQSYPSVNDYVRANDKSWIFSVLPVGVN